MIWQKRFFIFNVENVLASTLMRVAVVPTKCLDLLDVATQWIRTFFFFFFVRIKKANSFFSWHLTSEGFRKKNVISPLMSVNREDSRECRFIERTRPRRRQRPEPRRAKLVSGHNDQTESMKLPLGACLFHSLTPDWMGKQLRVFTEELQGW